LKKFTSIYFKREQKMTVIKQLFTDAMHLFFPHHCAGCGSDLLSEKSMLCLRCISNLPHTGYETIENNPIENIFRGRITISAATSQFYFAKGHLIQHLIHQLKYKGNKEVGEYLGALMGKSLLQSSRFNKVDYLIPLPLYADKEFKRGFNQAAVICNGMSEMMHVPVILNNVIRQRYTDTQTKKHRAERWENVEGSFAIKDPAKLHGKNILLVDDVITTGATLEACAQCMLQVPGIHISFATLATASK
jgi:ComF family protein